MFFWFYFIAIAIVALVVLFLILYYPNEQTTLLVKVVVGFTWFAALSVLVLVPADVTYTLLTHTTGKKEVDFSSANALFNVWWLTVYWYTLVCMVVVLPLLQKYADSGGFYVRDRILDSLKKNAKVWLAITFLALLGILVLILIQHFDFDKVLGWVMAVSNAYGLIGALFLLGYGLVDIPRKLWQKADIRRRELFVFQQAGIQVERATNAHKELSKAIAIVYKVSALFGRHDDLKPFMDRIESMIERVGDFQPQIVNLENEEVNLDYFDRQDLGMLRRDLRKGIEAYQRERERYKTVVRDYLRIHETIKNMDRAGLPYSFLGNPSKKVPLWMGYAIWWWKCRIKPISMKVLSVFLALLSTAIVLAEVAMSKYLPNLSVFYYVIFVLQEQEAAIAVICFLLLFYVMMCAYYTLFRISLFSFYLLVPRHTAPFSLASNALFMCRFVSPLCFNFITAIILPLKVELINGKNTEFWNNIGSRIADTPIFGADFTTYAPIIILPYILLVLFNAFNVVANFFDRKHRLSFDIDWDTTTSYACNGKTMLNKEIMNYDNGLEIGLTISEGLNKISLSELLNAEPLSGHHIGSGSIKVWNTDLSRVSIVVDKKVPVILIPQPMARVDEGPSKNSNITSRPSENVAITGGRERRLSSNTVPLLQGRSHSLEASKTNLDALFRDITLRNSMARRGGSNAPSIRSTTSTDRGVYSTIDDNSVKERTGWFRAGRKKK